MKISLNAKKITKCCANIWKRLPLCLDLCNRIKQWTMETVNRLIELLNSITTSTGVEYGVMFYGDDEINTIELASKEMGTGNYKSIVKASSTDSNHLRTEFPKLVAQIISLKL